MVLSKVEKYYNRKKYYWNNREWENEQAKEYHLKNHKNRVEQMKNYRELYLKPKRIEAMKIIGHGKLECSKCGCKDIRILQINHINGVTDEERHNRLRAYEFYQKIAKNERKIGDLNILCMVCNWAYFVEKKFGIKFQIAPTGAI